MQITCPYCETIYDTEIFELEPDEEFTEEECPNCGKNYAFEYYYQPVILNIRKLDDID